MKNETLAKWVADSMKADGVTPAHIASMNEADRANLVLAYVDAVGVKIRNMQNQLLTRPQNVPAFGAVVLSTL